MDSTTSSSEIPPRSGKTARRRCHTRPHGTRSWPPQLEDERTSLAAERRELAKDNRLGQSVATSPGAGVVVALDRGYLKGIGDIGSNLIAAQPAGVLWPPILLGIDVRFGDGKVEQSLGHAEVFAAFVQSSSRRVGR
jgi:hypothetical protein